MKNALDGDPGEEFFAVLAYYNPKPGTPRKALYDEVILGANGAIGCSDTGTNVGLNDVIFQVAGDHELPVADTYPPMKAAGPCAIAGRRDPSQRCRARRDRAGVQGLAPLCPPTPEDGTGPVPDGSVKCRASTRRSWPSRAVDHRHEGRDIIVGTSSRDRIRAGGGNDLVCARGGNDDTTGGNGRDTLVGGAGKDRLAGQASRDSLFGTGRGGQSLRRRSDPTGSSEARVPTGCLADPLTTASPAAQGETAWSSAPEIREVRITGMVEGRHPG